MRIININNLRDLQNLDLDDFEISENVEINIKLRIDGDEIRYPIRIFHRKPGLESKISVRAALFNKAKLVMPVEMHVSSGAIDTSTNFKALIYIMSGKAHADITPGLFIHEKNIQSAGHGVVIKNIKETDLRYIRSRGIAETDAKEMIINLG